MDFCKNIYKVLVIVFFLMPGILFAGNISSVDKIAWGDKIGWVNFGPDNGDVIVTDSAITGYAWSANYGWLNLGPSNGGVRNDGNGNLSGYGWGDKIGWVNFSGVTINPSTGIFSGQTTDTTIAGIINFSCDHCLVTTTWRKATASTSTPPAINTTTGSHSSSGTRISTSTLWFIYEPITYIYDHIVPDFIKPTQKDINYLTVEDYIRNTSPYVMERKWDIFPHKYSDIYVLAPLPREIRSLAVKFPTLQKILNDVGVKKMTDLDKLKTSSVSLPNISDVNKLPSEIVFAGDNMINLSSILQVSNKGEVEQKIETIVNKPIKLSVKPVGKTDSVTGYLTFISRQKNVSAVISSNSMFASALLSLLPSMSSEPKFNNIEKKMILSTFEYSDLDGDGIYTAEIVAPQTEGEYEIITLIKYSNPELGTKEMRLITVIDPEGYVFEKTGLLEARIPYAKVSLIKVAAGIESLWDAKNYSQDNPQFTDKTGKYSFLVPEGEYYVVADAAGYATYKGDIFSVREGKGVHFNIELVRTNSWIWGVIDWKSILIMILGAALLYNFWYERRMIKKLIESNNLKSIK